MSESLLKIEQEAVARPEPSPAEMIQMALSGGVTGESVAIVERLTALYERMQEKKAEQAFAEAFARLQADMPKINATKAVGDRYKYAPLEEIMRQVDPYLKQNGFSYSFSQRIDGERMTEIFTIQHVGGHKRCHEYTVRVGKGPSGCTETQADGAAGQYARRYALCDGLGIVIEHVDRDARLEGGKITQDQATDLRNRLRAVAGDEEAFLKYAGARTFEDIAQAKYGMCDYQLRRKEKTT